MMLQIPLIADLPVGLNFQDHATVFNQLFFDKPNEVGLFDKSEFPTFSSKVNFTLCGKGKEVMLCFRILKYYMCQAIMHQC